MRAWSRVEVPSLARYGRAPAVNVHDTATGQRFVSPDGGSGSLYVCGITPYDATHLGHAATYLAFDLLHRAWLDEGREVRYVQNVTDVDDPLIVRARETGADWRALADRETDLFRADCEALRILPPDVYAGVVESIPEVVAMVEHLIALGHAYQVDRDWYFSVHADPSFGAVSGLSEESMLALSAERGGDPDRSGKKHPLDCLLWQAEREDEPAWDSSLGRGRPGWHVECSAIARQHLGDNFDVQGGGSDLVFPHHEMSASQAQAAEPGSHFARAYVHAGMVGHAGEKMSKSRGNLVLVSGLRAAGVDPNTIRVALLGHHYRSDWEWTDDELQTAERRLTSWRSAVGGTDADRAERLVTEVRAALADDLDAPRALAALDAWGEHVGGGASTPDHGAGAQIVRDLLDARLGILL